jgi:RNA polymerase sigma factor (sigma-70 family)
MYALSRSKFAAMLVALSLLAMFSAAVHAQSPAGDTGLATALRAGGLVILVRHGATFAGGSARSWVLSIVRNSAYSWLRKNRPAAVVTVEDLEAVELEQANPGDRDADNPEAALIAKADADQLRAAIAALPTAFRETLVLRDIEGLDYREIAQATEVPIGTVMSRLARARHRLIAVLTNEQ